MIGRNEVHVPTHLFKCILVENKEQQDMALGCFVVPNEPIDRNRPLADFAVSIEDIEQRSGLQLFRRQLNINNIPFLCNQTSCELTGRDSMPPEVLEQVNYTQKIRHCQTLNQLQKVWIEVENKKYKELTNMLKTAYAKKLDELQQQPSSSSS